MKKGNTFFTLVYILTSVFFGYAQNNTSTKKIKAVRVNKAPKIDANPNDLQWQKADAATDFFMFEPGDGDPLPPEFDTQVKVVYDNTAIYILAVMKDPEPDKIPTIFGLRDQPIQTDYFSVVLNPFSTPNNNYLFKVFSSGSQLDTNRPGENDFSWNAVWDSKTVITQQGWIVEMAIPYSALRFPDDDNQTWSINFFRHIDRLRESYSWSYIDKTKSGDWVQFFGKLTNLTNLKPPIRLSLYPYASAVHTTYDGDKDTNFGFGMDLKYGFNGSYTLDATLIPDFSDTAYDEVVLNLGPFEQYYQEKRQFFTEGFDLFNKGKLFYSRRVGGTPTDSYNVYASIDNNETIVDNPDNVKLINAVKISGRSKNGLGIGFFNAITNKTEATVKNISSGVERKIVTEPYANYNVFVMDYNFKGNSTISLINTNVLRQGGFRDANVTGIHLDLYNKDNTLNFSGITAMSLLNDAVHDFTKGFKYFFSASKKIKEHRFGANVVAFDDKFDSNDLGFNRKNNFANLDLFYGYRILKPTKYFNSLNISFEAGFDRRYTGLAKVQNDFELNSFFTNKKYLSYGLSFKYVTDAYNYYEPRVPDRYFTFKAYGGVRAFLSTDYRKKLALDLKVGRYTVFNNPQNFYSFSISPRIRFSNRFNLKYNFEFQKRNNFKGFVALLNEDIVFGNRNQRTLINSISSNYFFNTKSAINLNLRYYWSPVYYTGFYFLNDNGTLTATNTYNENKNINYNVWNMDLGYTWEFAPGSNLSLLYRNSLMNFDQNAHIDLNQNIDNLLNEPARNSFIVKVIYYIDYNTVKNNWF